MMKVCIFLLVCTSTSLAVAGLSDTDEGLPSAIRRYETMERQLQKSFDILFYNYTSASRNYKQNVVYMCDTACQQGPRYAYGLTSAFLISVLAEKRFGVKPSSGFSLFDFYETRKYNWKLNMADFVNKPGQFLLEPAAGEMDQEANKYLLEKNLQTMDFTIRSKTDFLLVSGENNWIQDLRRNPITSSKMPWLYSAHACDVSRLIHAGLFQIPHALKRNLTDHLQMKVGRNKLVCIHTNEKEIVKKSAILEFLGKYLHHSSRFKLFFNNINSEAFFDQHDPEQKFYSEHQIRFDIDNMYTQFKYSNNDHHSFKRFKRFVDTHILKLCDVLVTTDSAVGIHAAHLRINSENLFCYDQGDIYRCTRYLIAGSFSTRRNPLVGMDASHVRKIFK